MSENYVKESEIRIDKLKEVIKFKERQLENLKNNLELLENQQYQHWVGKYYKLASTCYFRVDEIDSVHPSCVYVSGLKIQGGKGVSDSLEINFNGSEGIPDTSSGPEEVSVTDFLGFIDECLKSFEERLVKDVTKHPARF